MLDGDEWVIDGQKIWTSAGHMANWIFVLARTNPDAPKHKGISFLLVPMDQPGVEVRPIRMITGDAEFNEVFFTGARCPAANVVGEVNAGWGVAMTLLGYERGEAAATFPIMFRTELDRLLALAEESGRADDPRIRQRLAWCWSQVEVMRYLGMRTLTRYLAGGHPGPDASIFKLYWSEYHKAVTELAVDILGAEALAPTGRWPSSSFQADDAGAPNDSASWVGTFYAARAGTIYAGTSQVQRNILGEMVLGLPKEPGGPDGHLAGAQQRSRRVSLPDDTGASGRSRAGGRLRWGLAAAGGAGPPSRAVAHRRAPGAGPGPTRLVADAARGCRGPIPPTCGSACRPPTAIRTADPSRPTW